jgi:hypothetical protein
MKKTFLFMMSLILSLISSPIFAQIEDLGDDPDVPAPIDDYLWILSIVGLVYVFFKLRTSFLKSNIAK